MGNDTHENAQHYGYWNSAIVPLEEIHIHPQDLGVLRGYGVFDVMRTENRKPFLIEKHFTRLKHSAEILGLNIPISFDAYQDVIVQLIEKNNFEQSSIRTVLTGGPSTNAFIPEGKETFFILVTPFQGLDDGYFVNGAKIMTLEHGRQYPQAKVTQYVAAIKNAHKKQQQGALEILYLQNGKALEASTSNFAIIKDGVLIAPAQEILLGITRDLTLCLAKEHGIPVDERDVLFEEVLSADEVLLMATNKYIVPVVRVDDCVIGDGKPGVQTKKLMQAMQEFILKY